MISDCYSESVATAWRGGDHPGSSARQLMEDEMQYHRGKIPLPAWLAWVLALVVVAGCGLDPKTDGTGGSSGSAAGEPCLLNGDLRDEGTVRKISTDVGLCEIGHLTCKDGDWVADHKEVLPVEEVCDGDDNDCDGEVDNGLEGCIGCNDGDQRACFNGNPQTENVGACQDGVQVCVGGQWADCVGEVTPVGETCNGQDDDCDGVVDNGNPSGGQNCQTGIPGVCGAGTTACVVGSVICVQNQAPSNELCDGIDNNCNGTVDENLGTVSCGLGVCTATVMACLNGVPNNCVPFPSAQEVCDAQGFDENCDGQSNEVCACIDGDPQACYSGPPGTLNVGLCAAGTQLCVNGVYGPCVNEVLSVLEICDNADNDCNGQIDDTALGSGTPCLPGLPGLCASGTFVCQQGNFTCQQNIQPSVEVCNGLDDDCDGANDDGNPGGGIVCQTGLPGLCAQGTTACTTGSLVCMQNQAANNETCNGIDDNCNGQVDENLGTTTCGLGVCTMIIPSCQNGAPSACVPLTPTQEICDPQGYDEDCDGISNESCTCTNGVVSSCYNGPPGTQNVGACVAGSQVCVGGVQSQCGGQQLPSAEACDGIDNDCDGQIDDNIIGAGGPCTTGLSGLCSSGTFVCTNGGFVCTATKQSSAEVCNGLDDDCDGTIDNGNPGGGQNCQTGIPGVCGAGTTACSVGAVVCTANQVATSEVCNGKDDNCNGVADESLGTISCGLGLCTVTIQSCQNGALAVCIPLAPAAEVCDPQGMDENCNGQSNENCQCLNGVSSPCYTGPAGTQGVGACKAGSQVCVGGVQSACGGEILPTPEVCDGVDNDCNGQIDQKAVGTGVPCNTGLPGLCSIGTTACNGNNGVICVAVLQPSVEVCNGLDDDCNGVVDNGNPGGGIACTTGQPGICSGGTTSCSAGALHCVQNQIAANETCNGLDDNCNGTADENLGTISCGLGLCAATVPSCQNGALVACVPLASTTEVCDLQGFDENCNGVVNEGCGCINGMPQACYTGPAGTLSKGVCASGVQFCQAGVYGPCQNQVLPSAETCNGQDDDCDGQVDDSPVGSGTPCSSGFSGLCAPGTSICQGGAFVCQQNLQAAAEVCNGLDDNCDGVVDNGNPGGGVACQTGFSGICSSGTTSCSAGALICVQTKAATTETCNSLDDNCNGAVDDGLGTISCGLGLCTMTVAACQNGALVACVPLASTTEVCDLQGFDENCNGVVNEGCGCLNGTTQSCYTGPAGTKNVGLCVAGTQLCTNGAYGPCLNEVLPAAEICDNADNDCDGMIDDGNPGGGAPCSSGLPGLCTTGTFVCQQGIFTCQQNIQAGVEVCNGLDDDCDGVIDDGNPGGGIACTTGQSGICSSGTTSCSAGALICQQSQSASVELCNGLDDNCNGQTDEGLGTVSCGLGLCAKSVAACQNGAPVACVPLASTLETCDLQGLDEDCDGISNEGCGCANGTVTPCYTGPLGTQNVGVCTAGGQLCTNGALGACLNQVLPTVELCDGQDNDCNGVVDNAALGNGTPCASGLPGLCASGTFVCQQGIFLCQQNVQAVAESSNAGNCNDGADNDCDSLVDATDLSCSNNAIEVCNGIDDNANGQVDEGNPGGGILCSTNFLGVCAAGTTLCSGGQILCAQSKGASPEICNGLDDDCNGIVDNACTPPPQCNPNQILPEICGNGFDDDCDGVVDSALGQSCANIANVFTTTWTVPQAATLTIQGCVGNSFTNGVLNCTGAFNQVAFVQNGTSISVSIVLPAPGWYVHYNTTSLGLPNFFGANGPFPPGSIFGNVVQTLGGNSVGIVLVDSGTGGSNFESHR